MGPWKPLMCPCSFILKALHCLGCAVCHVSASLFIKHCTSIVSSQVISEYLLDIYFCNIEVALPSHVACHNDLFKGKIHSLITCWIQNVLLMKVCRFWTMSFMKKFPFRLEFFGKYWIHLSSSEMGRNRAIIFLLVKWEGNYVSQRKI